VVRVTTQPRSAIRFGFLGAGGIARSALGPAVHRADGALLQAVAARDADRAAALEPAGRAYDRYEALVADPDVDVVYISLSNENHKPWTLAALAHGKHVLCEKPLGLDAAEVEEMAKAAEIAGRLLVEAFWYRWHPRTRRLEQLVASGGLGELREIEAEFSFDGGDGLGGNFRLDPTRGGGALYDVGCYAISAALLGLREPVTVEAAALQAGATGVDLGATATLLDGEGTRADVACGIQIRDRQHLRLTGDAAVAEFGPADAFTNRDAPSLLRISERSPAGPGDATVEEFAPVDPYQVMVEAVAAAVRGDDAFLVGLDHSARIAAVADAVRARAST
jgi:predicted dehydrogenase